MTTTPITKRLLLFTTTLLMLGGCAATMKTKRGMVVSEVAIVGPTFKLENGRAFDVPFILGTWQQANDDMPNAYRKWDKKGAQHVKVYVGGRPEPLFGILSFHAIPASSTGPATRSFSVRIAPNFIEEASDGRISVVYELVPNKGGHSYGWVLWMSDRDF